MRRDRVPFPCSMCGCGLAGHNVLMWLLCAGMGRTAPRWPRRRRAYLECPECGFLATAQYVNRDLLEVM